MNKIRTLVCLLAALLTVGSVAVLVVNGAEPDTGPKVTYTATGTFTTPQVSGNDTLKLAGEPFTIDITAFAGSKPAKHGRNWAVFSPLQMDGVVHSGLLGTQPINIASKGTSVYLAVGPDDDPVQAAFPVKVVGIALTIKAQFTLPADTITKPLIHPFAAVPLSPTNTNVVYSNGTDSTTLSIASGSLTAALPSGGQ